MANMIKYEHMAMTTKLPNTGLTAKRTKFVQAITRQVEAGKPINLTQAALQSSDVKDPNVAKSVGSEIMKNHDVREAVAKVLKKHGLTLDTISKNLGAIAGKQAKYWTGDTILRANIELLKLHGAYPTQKTARLSLSVRANLKDMKYQEVQHELKRIDGELQNVMEGKVVK